MDEADPEHRHWFALLTRVRRYAARYARRQIVLCDAHTHGVVSDGGLLLFDLHAWPLMARDVKSGPASPQRVHLEVGYYNSIYQGQPGRNHTQRLVLRFSTVYLRVRLRRHQR